MPDLVKIPTSNAQDKAQEFEQKLRLLEQHYSILDRIPLIVELLGEKPAMYALLIEAVRPLQSAFGEGRMIRVRAQASADDILLKVAVQLPAGFENPEQALRSFDADWWLKNCHRSGGGLVFDYEIQDAI